MAWEAPAAVMAAAVAEVEAATVAPGAAGRSASLAPATRLVLAAQLAPAVMADAAAMADAAVAAAAGWV